MRFAEKADLLHVASADAMHQRGHNRILKLCRIAGSLVRRQGNFFSTAILVKLANPRPNNALAVAFKKNLATAAAGPEMIAAGGAVFGTAKFANFGSHDLTDHFTDTTAKVIAKDLACIFRRNLSKALVKFKVHCGLPVGCNRRMKVVFRRATSSPSGDHFSTFNNYWDASPVFLFTFIETACPSLFELSNRLMV